MRMSCTVPRPLRRSPLRPGYSVPHRPERPELRPFPQPDAIVVCGSAVVGDTAGEHRRRGGRGEVDVLENERPIEQRLRERHRSFQFRESSTKPLAPPPGGVLIVSDDKHHVDVRQAVDNVPAGGTAAGVDGRGAIQAPHERGVRPQHGAVSQRPQRPPGASGGAEQDAVDSGQWRRRQAPYGTQSPCPCSRSPPRWPRARPRRRS